MKTTSNFSKLGWSIFMLLLSAWSIDAMAQTIIVNLEVGIKSGATALVTTSKLCPHRPLEDGCIHVAKGQSPTIRYILAGAHCQDSDGHNKPWKLNGVQIAMIDEEWGTYPLPAPVATDFNANAATGWVNGVPTSATVDISDQNSKKYTVFYRVRAICEGTKIYLDPRIDNDGF